MLTLACVAIAAVVALVLYVVHTVKPKRVRLNAGILKLVTFNFEADSGYESREKLPPRADKPDATVQPRPWA